MAGVKQSARHRPNPLLEVPPDPQRPAPVVDPPLPMRSANSTADDLQRAVEEHQLAACQRTGRGNYASTMTRGKRIWAAASSKGARAMLDYLAALPGDTWNDRWLLLDAATSAKGRRRGGHEDWQTIVQPGCAKQLRDSLTAGLTVMVVLDMMRPSYAWQQGRQLGLFHTIGEYRDPDNAATIGARIDQLLGSTTLSKQVRHTLGKILAHTGKTIRQVTAEDLLTMDAALAPLRLHSSHRRSIEHLWRVLMDLDWISYETVAWPVQRGREPQLSAEQLIDRYDLRSPHRELFIEYLKQRRPSLDYSTWRSHAQILVKNFWLDITSRHPDLPSLTLTREIADEWKQRIRVRQDGELRVNHLNQLFIVRAFYLDLAQWALEDSYWAPWACAPPISRHEVAGYAKLRRKQVARTQQRTRQIAPVLPQLLAQARADRRASAELLATATAAGHGGSISVASDVWTVRRARPTGQVRIDSATHKSRNLSYEEDAAFWSWALIETFRLTGIRCEELLELTHVSIVPYRIPSTGEEIPLLHIAPSKTDEERLLVAGPELVHVLSEVIHRVRGGHQDIPLTPRWDPHDHEWGPTLPHLFAKYWGPELRPISPGTVWTLIRRCADRANIIIGGERVHFTTHDFRRIFATDALASGLPPHIVQVLLGHKSIATTQVYAAIYPQDVIRHHRTWIGQRRLTRPSEEYRRPTPAEWEEFEGHFAKRKVSLGSCGRAYGTNCHHEHACLRCALLRPDPEQADRLREIITNLHARISEAEQNTWLGRSKD
jgi:integrase